MTENTAVCQNTTKQEEPLVSIIIPVYNVSCYLSQCLESVIHQTYQNIEIIIIEDGSTDNSKDICNQYAHIDKRIRVISTENKGLASARNLGVSIAKGTFLSFIDSDDWIERHTIHKLVITAIQMDADIVCANICSEYVEKTVHLQRYESQVRVFRGKKILSAYAQGLFWEVAWNKLYRSKCFTQFSYPDGHNYEDVFTTWKRMKKLADEGGSVAYTSDELFHFRVRKSSISHTPSIQNVIDCWNAYYERYNGLPEYQEEFTASCYKAIFKMWCNYCSFTREEKTIAKGTIHEMSMYSSATFHRVLQGNYPLWIKVISIFSLSTSPLLMEICHLGGELYRLLREKITERKMFE